MGKKRYYFLLLLATILLLIPTCWAAAPANYQLTLSHLGVDGNEYQITQYSVLDGAKMRMDTIEDGVNTYTTIYRKDLNVIWRIDHTEKTYVESAYYDGVWEMVVTGLFAPDSEDNHKTGETTCLGLKCNVYKNGDTEVYYSEDTGLVLKYVDPSLGLNMVAKSYTTDKPNISFDLPSGYTQVEE